MQSACRFGEELTFFTNILDVNIGQLLKSIQSREKRKKSISKNVICTKTILIFLREHFDSNIIYIKDLKINDSNFRDEIEEFGGKGEMKTQTENKGESRFKRRILSLFTSKSHSVPFIYLKITGRRPGTDLLLI